MTKTYTEPDDGYYATISPFVDGWMVRYYLDGRHQESQAFSSRWFARMVARRRVRRMRKGLEVIR